jgi:large subunit ribosomal protein L17
MRHRNKGFKLGRTHAHRKATLAALSTALIQHKRIRTTLTKAKALRMYVEPLITRSKDDSTHNRREVFRHLQNKYAVTELFMEISGKVGEREGGYTRVIKLGPRNGDGTEMAVIELVDYNDVRPDGAAGASKKRTRRAGGRRGGKKEGGAPASTGQSTQNVRSTHANPAAGPTESATVDMPVADEVAVPVPERSEPNAELKAAAVAAAASKEAEGSDETAASKEAEGSDEAAAPKEAKGGETSEEKGDEKKS